MALEGDGAIYEHVKGRIVVYIPASVHNDSAFPFKIKEKIHVKIVKNKLIIEKVGKSNQ